VVSTKRIAISREELAAAVKAAAKPEVILEATYGWYWAVDLLRRWTAMCIWPVRRV
jgi:hypothetical protein